MATTSPPFRKRPLSGHWSFALLSSALGSVWPYGGATPKAFGAENGDGLVPWSSWHRYTAGGWQYYLTGRAKQHHEHYQKSPDRVKQICNDYSIHKPPAEDWRIEVTGAKPLPKMTPRASVKYMAGNFTIASVLALVIGGFTFFAGMVKIVGSDPGATLCWISTGSLVGLALVLFLTSQLSHLRANPDK